MAKNSAAAIQARVDNMYTDESVGRVFADVMYLLLENKRLREALAWYADENNYQDAYPGAFAYEQKPVVKDNGERARKALGGNDGS